MEKFKLELKWALIFTALALLWMFFEKWMGWHGPKIEQQPRYTNLFVIVALGVFIFALRDRRKANGGQMNWMQGFVSGAVISVIIALLSPLSQWITHNLISPEYFPNAIRLSVEKGRMTQEEAEAYFRLGNYIFGSAVFGMIIGLATSAVVAVFVRSK